MYYLHNWSNLYVEIHSKILMFYLWFIAESMNIFTQHTNHFTCGGTIVNKYIMIILRLTQNYLSCYQLQAPLNH